MNAPQSDSRDQQQTIDAESFLLSQLRQNDLFNRCPVEVQNLVLILLAKLSENWDEWNMEAEQDFTEDLLLDIFCLPETLPTDCNQQISNAKQG